MSLSHHALTGLAWLTWAGAGAAVVFALDLRIVALCIGAAVSVNSWVVSRKTVDAIAAQTKEHQRLTREHAAVITDRVLAVDRIMGWGARGTAIAHYDVARLREQELRPSDTGPFQTVNGVG